MGCPMERFFSQQNIERYRKLLDISTDEPERRLIFKLLAGSRLFKWTRTSSLDCSSRAARG